MKDHHVFTIVATIVVCVLILFFGYGSLSNTKTSISVQQNPAATIVPYTTLLQGTQSSVSDRVNYLITSHDDLVSLWQLIGATTTPPTVDFSTSAVIAVFAGKDSAENIAVQTIQDSTTRMVSVAIAKPSDTCPKTAFASPFEVVAVPATTLEFSHKDIVKTVSCAK